MCLFEAATLGPFLFCIVSITFDIVIVIISGSTGNCRSGTNTRDCRSISLMSLPPAHPSLKDAS